MIETAIIQAAHWARDFLSKPIGLGTSGGVTSGASLLAILKAAGEYAAPLGIILGVAVTAYSIYLNYNRRKDEKAKHQVEMELLYRQINGTPKGE